MFHSNVKKIMKDRGILAALLSERTGLSSATIAKARQDGGIAECRLSTLARLADGLGVATKDLYDEDARIFRMPCEERNRDYAEAAEEVERPYGSYDAGKTHTPRARMRKPRNPA